MGLGGHVEFQEDPVSSAIREFQEESGLTIADAMLRGTHVYIDENICGLIHIVVGTKYAGQLSESRESKLTWHRIDGLGALNDLAEHQRLFLDRILLGRDYFYSGVAIYRNGDMVQYADSDHFHSQRQTQLST